MCCIYIDDIKTDISCANRSASMPASVIGNIFARHPVRLHRVQIGCRNHLANGHQWQTTVSIGCLMSIVCDFNSCERVVLVNRIHCQGQSMHVLLIPESPFNIWRDICAWMDIHLLGGHDPPSTFGLDTTHCSLGFGKYIAQSIAMRNLIKPVARRDRADLNRLEQNVITGIVHSTRIPEIRHTMHTPESRDP